GGALRDALLKREIKDLDIECYDIEPSKFEEAMEKLKADGVGKSFFVFKYKNQIDISLPRVERKVAKGHKGFSVSLASNPKEASRRRDFTINAMFFDLSKKEVIDFWGGLRDLEKRVLRAVDFNTFIEDSLRILRAVQFSARFKFKIEKDTLLLCKSISLDDLPRERIYMEFEKLFRSDYFHYGLSAIINMDIDLKLWNYKISKSEFCTFSINYLRYKRNFLDSLKDYYFLTLLLQYTNLNYDILFESLKLPKRYNIIANLDKIPSLIKPSFVAKLAKKEPISKNPLNFHPQIIKIAKKIGVWDRPFDIGVGGKELMEAGFRGKEISLELDRIFNQKINLLDKEYKI
ncbi:MAG: CCA tRNA nucleotidyltransferase, partial [Epsilonproteobacteria bacterium]|nr:CCA tRNA nucleotidyltransferase [Campylobacterota bacterium]